MFVISVPTAEGDEVSEVWWSSLLVKVARTIIAVSYWSALLAVIFQRRIDVQFLFQLVCILYAKRCMLAPYLVKFAHASPVCSEQTEFCRPKRWREHMMISYSVLLRQSLWPFLTDSHLHFGRYGDYWLCRCWWVSWAKDLCNFYSLVQSATENSCCSWYLRPLYWQP